MTGRPLRLGLAGQGRWGSIYKRTIAEMEGLRIVATFDSTFRLEMLDEIELDGLIVATPPATHFAIARAAITRGIPVLIEKPLTLSVSEAQQLLSLSREHSTRTLVDHIHLFSPAFQALKREVALRGGPKAIHAIDAEAGNWGVFRRDTPVLWDWGAHDVAMILDLMGAPPKRVTAKMLETKVLEQGFGQSIQVELGYDDLAAKIFISNLRAERMRSLKVRCGSDIFAYDDTRDQKLTVQTPERENFIAIPQCRPLNSVLSEFAALIWKNVDQISDIEFGLAVVEILDACERSMNSKASVLLN